VRGLLPEALRLSAFPPALLRLFEALDAANVATIAAAVHADPVLAALVIRAGNGAADGRARATRSVRESIVFLGLHRVRALALGKLLNTMLVARTPLDVFLWEQAIGIGVRARELALATTDDATADLALLAGLLHPVGAIALATAHRERYDRVLLTSIRDDRPLVDVERDEFGVASATVTRELLHAWHVEPLLRCEHGAAAALQPTLEWASAVTLAANPAWQALTTRLATPVRWLELRLAATTERLGLDAAVVASIAARSADAVTDVRRLFGTD
jgi:HD-like signal output (HDOD) protein